MQQRELSISTAFDYDLPIDVQIPLIAEAGFTHLSLGARESHAGHSKPEGRVRLKRLLQRHSLRVDTIHGPRADQSDTIKSLTAVVAAAADLGASTVVVHGGPFGFEAEELPSRLDMLRRTCEALDGVAEQTGIRFALENVLPGPATELVSRILPSLDPRHFGFCYDSAHDQIGGPRSFDLLADLSDRVIAVHLSDRIREFVDHVIPGEGFIDWNGLSALLQTSNFTGPLLLEVGVTHSAEKDPRRFLKLAYERGCQIHQRVFGE